MSDQLDHPIEIWLNPLIRLLNWWADHDPKARRQFVRVYEHELTALGCVQFTPWLFDLGLPPMLDEEVEATALHALIRALLYLPHQVPTDQDPTTPQQRQELLNLKREARATAQKRLDLLMGTAATNTNRIELPTSGWVRVFGGSPGTVRSRLKLLAANGEAGQGTPKGRWWVKEGGIHASNWKKALEVEAKQQEDAAKRHRNNKQRAAVKSRKRRETAAKHSRS